MKTVILTQGQVALVDDEDYEKVCYYKWQAKWSKCTKSWYANNAKLGRMSRHILDVTDPNIEVDHKNHDTLNNQRSNLRKASHQQNGWNRKKRVDNQSGFTGVSRSNNLWRVQITMNKKRKNLGYFKSKQAAAFAFELVACVVYGEFANLYN